MKKKLNRVTTGSDMHLEREEFDFAIGAVLFLCVDSFRLMISLCPLGVMLSIAACFLGFGSSALIVIN